MVNNSTNINKTNNHNFHLLKQLKLSTESLTYGAENRASDLGHGYKCGGVFWIMGSNPPFWIMGSNPSFLIMGSNPPSG